MKIKTNIIIGIDCGANGGICVHDNNTHVYYKMPKDITEFRNILDELKTKGNIIAFVEKVNIRPDDYLSNKESMGKIYRVSKLCANFEQIKTTLALLDIPTILVHPLTWQCYLNVHIKGMAKSERKKQYVMVANNIFRNNKHTLWNADAALITFFGVNVLKDIKKLCKLTDKETLHKILL